MKITIEKPHYIKKIKTIEIDVPDEVQYYFITGIRKSYKVVPKFQDWEGGNGEVHGYDIVEVGLSFECVVEQFYISVTSIPNILRQNESSPYYSIIDRIINHPEVGRRTEDHFENDLQRAIDRFNGH